MTTRMNKRAHILLRLRRQEEDNSVQAFASAKAQVDSIRGSIERLGGELHRQDRHARTALADSQATDSRATRAMLAQYRQAVTQTQAAIADESGRLEVAQQQLRQRREELLMAMRRRKAVGKLTQRLIAAAELEQRRDEVKQWDDLYATSRAAEASAES